MAAKKAKEGSGNPAHGAIRFDSFHFILKLYARDRKIRGEHRGSCETEKSQELQWIG